MMPEEISGWGFASPSETELLAALPKVELPEHRGILTPDSVPEAGFEEGSYLFGHDRCVAPEARRRGRVPKETHRGRGASGEEA